MSDDDRNRDEDVNFGLTVEERERLSRRLGGLPAAVPPRAVWQRIEAQARAEGLVRSPGIGERWRWLAGSGIAAAVVLAVLNLPFGSRQDSTATGPGDAGPLPTVPAYDPAADAVRYSAINALMVQSQLLERDLRRLPDEPEVGRAGTLAAIDELQGRIAAIDQQLSDPDAGLGPDDEEAYWRERVRLMDSLLRLRYAQAQRQSF